MSYESDECKLLIDEAIHDYLHDDTETEMTVKDWFYDLRKQATKADEYEAKAKAWDKYKAHMESYIAGEVNEEELVSDLESDYFESGGYDAKK